MDKMTRKHSHDSVNPHCFALKLELIICRAHGTAQQKRPSQKTECFSVILRSKLDPYQDDLLYIHVINS